MPLQQNLTLAQQTIAAIDGLGYNSNNRGVLLDGLPANLSDTRGNFAIFIQDRTAEIMQSEMGPNPHGDLSQDIDKVLAPAAIARRLHFANCEGRAALALIYATKRSAIRPLELCNMVGGDHVFMVIGRTQGTVPNIDGWNADAVVCDPWARDFYAKDQYRTKLDQQPLLGVRGANQNAMLSYYARISAGGLPDRWIHYLNESGVNDIWP